MGVVPAAKGADHRDIKPQNPLMTEASDGCLTVWGKPLPDGRGSVAVALISQGLPSRDRQGAVFVSKESPKWLSTRLRLAGADFIAAVPRKRVAFRV
jgi:hypothetical protein